MRLWHYKLISYLPDSQLKAQWRELNSVFKNQPKHILINYVYTENELCLLTYAESIICEMKFRGFKISSMDKMRTYFINRGIDINGVFMRHYFLYHDDRYLTQCFYNLQEKYDGGQKDFTEEQYYKLEKFMRNRFILTPVAIIPKIADKIQIKE